MFGGIGASEGLFYGAGLFYGVGFEGG